MELKVNIPHKTYMSPLKPTELLKVSQGKYTNLRCINFIEMDCLTPNEIEIYLSLWTSFFEIIWWLVFRLLWDPLNLRDGFRGEITELQASIKPTDMIRTHQIVFHGTRYLICFSIRFESDRIVMKWIISYEAWYCQKHSMPVSTSDTLSLALFNLWSTYEDL